MRRSIALLTLAAALLAAGAAAAALQPVRRQFGELTLPRVRPGTVQVPAGHARGRVRVIVALRLPPLAAAGGELASRFAVRRRLDVASASSRMYLARLAAAQRAAAAELKRAIPEARITRRFRILLDGLTVELPARRLPALARLPFAARIYPSLRYTLALNESPSVIGADTLAATTGARGEGVKIAVVDDGVDQENPFFNPAGYQYPPGFPKGGLEWTTPKVIVARAYPGPNSGRGGRLAVDRRASFHGTHVAGIAAGDAGTEAPAGPDHPRVAGLSGVAPRAWLGNYRVFNVPTPIGHSANTPEIVSAFEDAVTDGMDVINFSGGGPQTDPANDAMVETIRNVVAAGVVPVIAAGNDRDEFGLGTVGSPGTVPEAITVAAASNRHVFANALTVLEPDVPADLKQIPFARARGGLPPPAWETNDQTLVDVGTIVGVDDKPVDRRICNRTDNPNALVANPLPAHSLDGAIALASRGSCTFVSKALRAQVAGAVGLILVDNRPGEANPIPIRLAVPAGMISDVDGARLREALAAAGGRAKIRLGRDESQIETGRSGVVTSFSSAGPTSFGHELKPDISAPGGQILSSTLPEFAGSQFAVFDGTSMATPHVSGSAALLVERHGGWTPQQIKSALISTAAPAWANTARTVEAPVVLAGGGLVNLPGADDPQLFTDPVSLSLGDLNVNAGARSRSRLVELSDAGGGAGTWQIEVRPQSASSGASVDVQPAIELAPGGTVVLPVTARVAADAAVGDDYGFLVLRKGSVARRIPYDFSVTRPSLPQVRVVPLQRFQVGDTRFGASRVSVYRYPSAAFGPPPTYTGTPVDEDGAERVYVTHLNQPAANLGVSVIAASPGALIEPWLLGSLDENDVQGYAGLPVNVNNLTFDYRLDIGTAAAVFPRQKAYYVAVDSGRDEFTGRSLGGRYLLRAWVNDVTPPRVQLLTTRVAAGRPTLVARVLDGGSGVDPLSLAIGYKRVLVGAAAYDPFTGLAVFPLPRAAPRLTTKKSRAPAAAGGRTRAMVIASDFQEAKNVGSSSDLVYPNTAFQRVAIDVVDHPTVTWLAPERNVCVRRRVRLVVVASATRKIDSVRFLDGDKEMATVKRGTAGLFATTWKTAHAAKGRHELKAVVVDRSGAEATAMRIVRVCR